MNSTLPISTANSTERKLLLQAKDLRKAFDGQQVLDGVSLFIYAGDVILLRGANGSGKTTLLNILTGNLAPDSGEILTFTHANIARFKFPIRWWTHLNINNNFTPERMSLNGVRRTWQEIRLFNSLDLRDNLSVAAHAKGSENPLRSLFLRPAILKHEHQVRSASEATLREIGLGDRFDSSAARISLGESKRVSIAQAIQSAPRIVFLDEPLSGLDAAGVDEVMQLLQRLTREQGLTLVIIEHASNIPHLSKFATITLTLENGRISPEEGTAIWGNKQPVSRGHKPSAPVAIEPDKAIVNLPGGANLIVSDGEASGPVTLEVKDLVIYRNKRLVVGTSEKDGSVKGISFKLIEGQKATLFAPNGWGKTTLLEAIAGLQPVTSGSIQIFGKPVAHLPVWQRSNLGIYLLRAGNNYFSNLIVKETLQLSGINHVPRFLIRILDRRMGQLSGGEKQMVAITCAYGAKGRRLLLLDEPFSALDEGNMKELTELIKTQTEATTIIASPSP